MNKIAEPRKPYPIGTVDVSKPFPEVKTNGLVKGYNPDTSRATRSHDEADKPNYLMRRLVALGVAGLAIFGAVKVGERVVDRVTCPDVPALDTPYTLQPGDTADAIARHSMPNEEYRGLMDELTDEANNLKKNPGFNAGNTINVPHQYVEYLKSHEQQSK